MLKTILPVLLAVGAGMGVVVQQVMNARLRGALDSALWAALASYVVGTIFTVLFLLALREPFPAAGALARVPPWAWLGGFFGAVFIALAILLVPRIGAAAFMALLVAGQMLASLAFDHFGWLGLERREFDGTRLLGAALLIAGVVLIRR